MKSSIYTPEYLKGKKFGKLAFISTAPSVKGRSHCLWICDCGNETMVPTLGVFRYHTTSCGKCNSFSKEHFESTKYGKLRMLIPIECSPGSGKKVVWLCDCGNTRLASLYVVTTGYGKNYTQSCGKCNILSKEHFETTKYGKLRMTIPNSYYAGSHKKVSWSCDCGNIRNSSIASIMDGLDKSSCGKCNLLDGVHWKNNEYGRLSMLNPGSFHKGCELLTEKLLKAT